MSIAVQIPQFEGPLGLLLYLIRKEEMDIFDIDIYLITSQYLGYIKKMKQFDLEVAGDFVAMAATLIQIKSRMLLPNYNEEGEEDEALDPRKELVDKLLEYQKFKEISKSIYEKPLLGRDVFRRGKSEGFATDEEGEIIVDEGGLFALIGLYRGAIRKAKNAIHRVSSKTQSIAGRILEIKDRLLVGKKVIMRDLLDSVEDFQAQLLVTFLSCLELGKMGLVSVYQAEVYGDIYLTAKKTIDGNVVERVEEYEQDSEAIARSLMGDDLEDEDDDDNDGTLNMASSDEEVSEPLVAVSAESDFSSEISSDASMNFVADEDDDILEIATDEDIEDAEREMGDLS